VQQHAKGEVGNVVQVL